MDFSFQPDKAAASGGWSAQSPPPGCCWDRIHPQCAPTPPKSAAVQLHQKGIKQTLFLQRWLCYRGLALIPHIKRGCLKMICKNHERQPSFLRQAVEKLSIIFKKQRTNSEGQRLPLKKVRCFLFWRRYATVGTTRCVPNRPVCAL